MVFSHLRQFVFILFLSLCGLGYAMGGYPPHFGASGEFGPFDWWNPISLTPGRRYDPYGDRFADENLGPVITRAATGARDALGYAQGWLHAAPAANRLLPRRASDASSSTGRNAGPEPVQASESYIETDLDQLWTTIFETYCRRAELHKRANTTRLVEDVYFERRLQRAGLLLAEYLRANPVSEVVVSRSVLEELRVMPTRENGVIDRLNYGVFTKAGRMLMARLLGAHKTIDSLRLYQQLISRFQKFVRTSVTFPDGLVKFENYFISTMVQETVCAPELLKMFFPNLSDDLLSLIAQSPLAHIYLDRLNNFESMMAGNDQQLHDAKVLWQQHVERMTLFLIGLKELQAKVFTLVEVNSDPLNNPINGLALDLYCIAQADWIDRLQGCATAIDRARTLQDLDELIGQQFMPLLSERKTFINAYHAVAEVDVLWRLAQLVSTQSFCFPEYIDNVDQPQIDMVEGASLLCADAVQYTIALGDGNKRAQLVVGDNGSGKSIYMNTLGVAVHLAQTIGAVPAQRLALTPVTLMTSCNIGDSVADARSLFQAQAGRVGEIMTASQEGFALVILDEPVTSTKDTIANAFLVKILQNFGARPNVLLLMSTHYNQPIGHVAAHRDVFGRIDMVGNHTAVEHEYE